MFVDIGIPLIKLDLGNQNVLINMGCIFMTRYAIRYWVEKLNLPIRNSLLSPPTIHEKKPSSVYEID
jgi:hypothetical protein